MKRTGRGMLQPRDGDDDGQMGAEGEIVRADGSRRHSEQGLARVGEAFE